MGPWFHSQVNRTGWELGPFKWNGDTAADFRANYLIPFFDHYLRGTPETKPFPQALIYNPVENHWDEFSDWQVASQQKLTPLYLQADMGLGFGQAAAGADNYVSDPAKPVPYLNPPIPQENDRWRTWLEQDQRFVSTRPDVLSYTTPVLTRAVRIEGAPIADIFAKTTGTDGDFVVKLIDVYPAAYPEQPEMGGYQMPIAMDIFRGRYRMSYSDPSPIPATDVRLVDKEDPSRPPPEGEPGEIVAAGPQIMKGYWNRPDADATVFVTGADGRRWLRTGDVGAIDGDGFIRIVDRLKDMIAVGGFKVFPSQIEALLYKHPAVKEALVIGLPDAYRGEHPRAYVTLADGAAATGEELAAWLNPQLGKHERVDSVVVRLTLPKTLVGKLSRKDLIAVVMAVG
jgi:acyl-CoA synthetase (AMP-forming)/AMP-acid ligase II